jgi:glycosyltransferase involved in cell wall biosynthesis
MSRRVLDVFNAMPENYRFIRGMISWVGFKQVPFLYHRPPRIAGETQYTLSKMLGFAFDGITSFSVRPLRVALYCGLWLFAGAIVLLGYTLRAYFLTKTVPGWTSLMTVVLLSSALQFLFLGLIGEYLGRLYTESKRRPLFIIQDVLRAENGALHSVAGKSGAA